MSFVVSLLALTVLAQEDAAGIAAAAPALAALPHTTLVGYPVAGGHPNELRLSINEARPTLNGQALDATTTWRYWKRWRNDANGQCEPASAEVTVVVTVTLPHLVDRSEMRPRDLGVWDAYVATLAGHEANRARIVIAGVQDIQAAMRAAMSCEAMQQAAVDVEGEVAKASTAYTEGLSRGLSKGPRYP